MARVATTTSPFRLAAMVEPIRRLGTPTAVATVVVMLALVGSVIALHETYEIENQARSRAERSTDVLGALYAVMGSAADAQTGQRGYVLTGEERFLKRFEVATARLPVDLDRLEAVSTEPAESSQEAAIARLRTLAATHAAYLQETIDFVAEADGETVLARIREGTAEGLLDEMRVVAGVIDAEEDGLRLEAFAQARTVERLALGLQSVLALSVLASFVLGTHYITRTLRAENVAGEAIALRAANDRADLLAREMDHRVKNVFALVAAVVSASARGETDVVRMSEKVRGRIQALARAHAVSRGSTTCPTPTIADLVEVVIEPYGSGSEKLIVSGEDVDLPTDMVTPLGLIIHELATNAAKYGALGRDGGRVEVDWKVRRRSGIDIVEMEWTETGMQNVTTPVHEGFGTRMTQMSARQLHGGIERHFAPDGLSVRLWFPID